MTDEEKEAIKNIKKEFEKNHILPDIANEDLGILLNLIEKQSKEIEELKEKNEYLPNWVSKKYVSKAKIKAKIEKFKTVRDTILENENELNRPMMTYDLKRNDYCEKMLQSLLEKE